MRGQPGNEFFFAITSIQSEELKPVTRGFSAFRDRFVRNWNLTSVAGLSVILPMLVLLLAPRRRFTTGLASGALKQ